MQSGSFSKVMAALNGAHAKRYFVNSGWLMFSQGAGLFLFFIVGVLVARFLGPSRYGQISYYIALLGFFTAPIGLGDVGVVTRELVRARDDAARVNKIMGTALGARAAGTVIAFSAFLAYLFFVPREAGDMGIGILVGAAILFYPLDVIKFYYKGKVRGKYAAVPEMGGVLASSAWQVAGIAAAFPLLWFAAGNLLKAGFTALLLVFFFRLHGQRLGDWRFCSAELKIIVKDSFPMLFAGFFAVIYLQIDQVMIKHILGNHAVGIYNSAVRVATGFYFIPIVLTQALFPAIVRAKDISPVLYQTRLKACLALIAGLSYLFMLPIVLNASFVVHFLFGDSYSAAGPILGILGISTMFVFLGQPRGAWLVNERLTFFNLVSNILAAGLNIILNYFWIPRWGGMGAAWATLISYFMAFVGLGLFFKKIRPIAALQIKGLLIVPFFPELKAVFKQSA